MRRFRVLPVIALFLAGTAAAQEPDQPARDSAFQRAQDEPQPEATPDTTRRAPIFQPDEEARIEYDPSTPWRTSWFPYLSGGTNEGPILSLRVRYWQPAEYESRVTATGALTLDAGINAQGSRRVGATFVAPELVDGWRFAALAGAVRQARFGYFGLGNDTDFDKDLDNEAQPYFFRVRRTRYVGAAEVTRRITGPFQVGLAGSLEWTRFTDLPGPSRFNQDFGSELEQSNALARLVFVVDGRDNEYNTRRGYLVETGAGVGHGDGEDYTVLYAIARGYLPIGERTVVAARIGGSGMGGTPPLNARYTIPAWENPISVLGGDQSHRALDEGRLTGRHTLFGNLEVRHEILPFGDLGALLLLGFVDAGRVFEQNSFELTLEDYKVGAGGGIGLRILRSTILTFNLAGGPDGLNFSLGSGWMF